MPRLPGSRRCSSFVIATTAVIAVAASLGACGQPSAAATPVASPPVAAAAKPAEPPVVPAVAAGRAQSDSINKVNEGARLAQLKREVLHSDSLDRASMTIVSRQSELRDALIAMIHFDADQSKVRDADRGILDHKAAIMAANKSVKLRIDGFADDRPSDEEDQALGLRRAEAARSYLAEHGVDTSRVAIGSTGHAHLLCEARTDACRTENRRDTFFIVDAPNLLQPGTVAVR